MLLLCHISLSISVYFSTSNFSLSIFYLYLYPKCVLFLLFLYPSLNSFYSFFIQILHSPVNSVSISPSFSYKHPFLLFLCFHLINSLKFFLFIFFLLPLLQIFPPLFVFHVSNSLILTQVFFQSFIFFLNLKLFFPFVLYDF